ncbi:hypothetical protein KGM_209138 [Danaus plexippus plexippus]|uniref:Uncharacterized protein n=1 Tax=Danaus plexippus plexippus TaxID=278856 RepID=A0A212F8M5_DANPL|nr:hypothetical protein KGM_209138 [Danaus plexippus plexippus]
MEAVVTINTDALKPKNIPCNRPETALRRHRRLRFGKRTLTIVD